MTAREPTLADSFQIRPMLEQDLPVLLHQSHDIEGGDERDAAWFMHPARSTLVLTYEGKIIGHTAWSRHLGYTLWDQTYLAPEFRGQGLARFLMETRAEKTPGLVFGGSSSENQAMNHLLETMGFHICQRAPGKIDLVWARDHSWEHR